MRDKKTKMRKIIRLIKEKKVIMFGETHGVKEIPQFLENFMINKLKDINFVVALEIPEVYKNKIKEFIKNEKGKCGLANEYYYNLIKKLESKNIKIFLIDDYITSQEDKEQNLSNEILNLLKNNNKIIVVTGDFHASSLPINVNGKIIQTAGSILKNSLKKDFASIRFVSDNSKETFNDNFDAVINYNEV